MAVLPEYFSFKMELLNDLNQDYLANPFLGARIYDWLIMLAIWVIGSVAFILLRRFLVWRVGAISRKTTNAVDDVIADLLRKTRGYFLVALALFAAAVIALPEKPVAWISRIVVMALLLQVARWGSYLIDFWIQSYKERKLETDAAAVTTVQAMGFLGRIALWAVVVLVALDNLGIDVTALVAGLGIGGIAVALALQNILGDLFASLSIVLDKPFVVGDFLNVDSYLGSVEYIGLKTTRMRSLSGEQIVFSNGDLMKSRIRNFKRMFERRIVFSIGVTYQTPHEKLAAIPGIIKETVEAQDRVRFDRAHFKSYGDFALQYEVVYFVLDPDFNLYMDIQQAINLDIYRKFEQQGISFAYPTQSLFVERFPSGTMPEMANGEGKA